MISQLLNVSRPRFWMYVIGSYLIGIGAHASLSGAVVLDPRIALWLLYFTFPANIFVYGINDLADADTDNFNPKKGTYEAKVTSKDKRAILWAIVISHLAFLPLFLQASGLELFFFAIFIVFNLAYSLPPLRLKRVPFADSTSNGIICAAIGCMGYVAAGGSEFSAWAVLAGGLWSAAMHAYSAIPDIEADRSAGIQTIATVLGRQGTVFACMAIYLSIIAIFICAGYLPHILLVIPYLVLMGLSLRAIDSPPQLFKVYMAFPFVTYIVGYLTYLFNGIV